MLLFMTDTLFHTFLWLLGAFLLYPRTPKLDVTKHRCINPVLICLMLIRFRFRCYIEGLFVFIYFCNLVTYPWWFSCKIEDIWLVFLSPGPHPDNLHDSCCKSGNESSHSDESLCTIIFVSVIFGEFVSPSNLGGWITPPRSVIPEFNAQRLT